MKMTALTRPASPRRLILFVLLLAGSLVTAYAVPGAQAPAKKAMTIDDYTKWRSIERQAISGDGKWVVYTLQTTNVVAAEAKPVLHLLNLENGAEVTVADATDGTFSPDSKWLAYQVDPGAAQRGRGGRGGAGAAAPPGAGQSQTAPSGQGAAPTGQGGAQSGSGQGPSTSSGQGRGGGAPAIPPRRVELRNLATGEVQSWQDIGTFAFNATSTHMFLRRRGGEAAPAAGGRGGGGAPGGQPPGGTGQAAAAAGAPAAPRGVDAILLDLRTGRQQLLGSVADIAFNRTGELLAYTVDAAVKDVNGLFVFDTRTGRTTALDSDAKSYNRLDVERGRQRHRRAQGKRRREDARARQRAPRVPGRRGGAEGGCLRAGARRPRSQPKPTTSPRAGSSATARHWPGARTTSASSSGSRNRSPRRTPRGGRPTRPPTWTCGTPRTIGCSRCR